MVAPYYESWKSSDFTIHTHAKIGLVCVDCHTRTARDGLRELASVLTGRNQLPLRDHKVIPEKECFGCHVSYEYLAGLTKDLEGPDGRPLGRNPHDSHWGQLECGICHKMHKPSEDFCSECHRFPAIGPAWSKALPRFLRIPITDSYSSDAQSSFLQVQPRVVE